MDGTTDQFDWQDTLAVVESYWAAGLQPMPIRSDGSKTPAVKEWTSLQDPANRCQLQCFVGHGVALICGRASRGLEVIDFDDPSLYETWCELVEDRAPGVVQRLAITETPREENGCRGKHVCYRCDKPSGNQVLAYREGGRKAAIETRGEGGYILAPGCNPRCHPSGRLYEPMAGSLLDLPRLTMDERQALFDCARALNRYVELADHGEADTCGNGSTDTVGDQFARVTTWESILTPHGWIDTGADRWRRPGKERGWSASTKCKSKAGRDLLRVFSSNANLAPGTYSKFGAYTVLNHGGDYRAATKALVALGFGKETKSDGFVAPGPPPVCAAQLVADHPRLRPPVIHGLLRQGETLNIIAAPKAGKSWLATGLALSLASGCTWLETFPCESGRVLLIDGELHPETIAHRLRDVVGAMGLGTKCLGQVDVLPLRGRGVDLVMLGAINLNDIATNTYKLVVLDALYRFLPPGTSENDNAAMMALYNAIDAYAGRLGAAWVNIHHASKGDQSGKGVTDVGSGAGAQSRAADTHLVIRPHMDDDVAVVNAVVRSWPPVEPLAIRWSFPVWTLDRYADPRKLRRPPTARDLDQAAKDEEGFRAIVAALAGKDKTLAHRDLRAAVRMGSERLNRLLDILASQNRILRAEVSGERGGTRYEYKLAPAGGDDGTKL